MNVADAIVQAKVHDGLGTAPTKRNPSAGYCK
jgi:hypothetical protein